MPCAVSTENAVWCVGVGRDLSSFSSSLFTALSPRGEDDAGNSDSLSYSFSLWLIAHSESGLD